MTTYFKAIRPDGGSFHDPGYKWSTEPGGLTEHPAAVVGETGATHYLSVSTVATDCTGMGWPCRLLEVEPVGDTWVPNAAGLPNKVAGSAFRTVRELPAHEVFGPFGAQVAAVIDRTSRLMTGEIRALAAANAARDALAARNAAWNAAALAARNPAALAAWNAAAAATWYAVAAATWYAANAAVRDATLAWLVKDEITDEQFATLTEAWNSVIGKHAAAADGDGA